MGATWSLQDAKNRFSTVVNAAQAGSPQTVTRRGVPVAVVVSAEEYQRLHRLDRLQAPSFVDLLLAIPQGGEDIERLDAEPRDVEL